MAEFLTIACSDGTSDLMLDKNGNLIMATGRLALSYITQNAIRTVRGELPFDTDYGVPYFTTIFASPPNVPMWEYYVKDTALSVTGVISVLSFRSDIVDAPISATSQSPNYTKAVKYEMVLETEDGEISILGGGGQIPTEGDLDAIAAQEAEEAPRYISIVAPVEWIDANGIKVYSETSDIIQGTLLYSSGNIQEQLLAGETEEEARKRLSQSAVSDVFYGDYIVTGTVLSGLTAYWRDDTGDTFIGGSTMWVQRQANPINSHTENPIYATGIWNANPPQTVQVFQAACPTATPTDEERKTYSFDSQYLGDGNYNTSGIGDMTNELYLCFARIGDSNTGCPYLEVTGKTATIWDWNNGEKTDYIFCEMKTFTGSTKSGTAWIESSLIGGTSWWISENFPASEPIQSESGGWSNEDTISVGKTNVGWYYIFNGLTYEFVSGYPDMDYPEVGYIFQSVYAQEWTTVPTRGSISVYTSSESTIPVCYNNSELTGGTTAINKYGYGPRAIFTTSGGTFYNAI